MSASWSAKVIRVARFIHVLSACWILGLGIIILIDVIGRSFFATPLLGTTEIVKNSVVAVTFLQLPLAIYSGSMLRTTILVDVVGPVVRKLLRTIACLLGALFFAIIVYSAWEHMIDAWRIGEYEGEGALRVPTYPVRTLMIATSVFAAIAYLMMIYFDWTDQLEEESAFPGVHDFDMRGAENKNNLSGEH